MMISNVPLTTYPRLNRRTVNAPLNTAEKIEVAAICTPLWALNSLLLIFLSR